MVFRLPIICLIVMACLFSCKEKTAFYTSDDFEKAPKTDAHFHYNTSDSRYLKYAVSLNIRLISINVDTEMDIDSQLQITSSLKHQFPDNFAFLGTFTVDSFGKKGFAERTIARIDQSMKAGASGIKIWKNIGMVLKDTSGKYVMVDDPAFTPVFNYLEANHIPLTAHLGEPKNCWLSDAEMTLDNDRRYYKKHPEYHMFLHPEAPTYQDQIMARDNLLKEHPKLQMTGAHLASLEWSVDELAKRFDRFPLMKADLAARIGQLQYQSLTNRERIRNFLIKYQDRMVYGSDRTIDNFSTFDLKVCAGFRRAWFEHWAYMATDSTFTVKDLGDQKVQGLNLPREVVDKIFNKNAEQLFVNGKH